MAADGCATNTITLSEAPKKANFQTLATQASNLMKQNCAGDWAEHHLWEVVFFLRSFTSERQIMLTNRHRKGYMNKETIITPQMDLEETIADSHSSTTAQVEMFPLTLCNPGHLLTGAIVEATSFASANIFYKAFRSMEALADSSDIKNYANGLITNMNGLGNFNLLAALKLPKVVEQWNKDRMLMSSTISKGTSEKDLATLNWEAAYNSINNYIKTNKGQAYISIKLVQAVHQRLTHGSTQNDVVPGGTRRKATLVGGKNPLPGHFVLQALGMVSKWFSNGAHYSKHGSLVAALAVFMSECVSIHPFLDGNGRVCRAVVDLVLMSKGLPPAQFKSKADVDVAMLLDYSDSDTSALYYQIASFIPGVTQTDFRTKETEIATWLKEDGDGTCTNSQKLMDKFATFTGGSSPWGNGDHQAKLAGKAPSGNDRIAVGSFAISDPSVTGQFTPFLKATIKAIVDAMQNAIDTAKATN